MYLAGHSRQTLNILINRPFPSSLVPLFQSKSKCETFHMKMSSTHRFFFMQIKVIFIRMVSHLDSLWNRGTRELGNGLLQFPQMWLVYKLLYSALINLQNCNRTVGCNRTVTRAYHFRCSPQNPPITKLIIITIVTNTRDWLCKIVEV